MKKEFWAPLRFIKLDATIVIVSLALSAFGFIGCNSECEDCSSPIIIQGPSPNIKSFSLKQGGRVISKTDTSADITIYRNDRLRVEYEINLPNGFFKILNNDQIESISISLYNKDTLAKVKLNYTNIHSGIPLNFIVMDRAFKTVSFKINPTFEPGINPMDIIDVSWEKANIFSATGLSVSPLCVTSDQSLFGTSVGMIVKLVKGSNTWQEVDLPHLQCEISSMVRHPSGDLFALACLEDNEWMPMPLLMKSSDNGNSWSILKTNLTTNFNDLKISKEGSLFLNIWIGNGISNRIGRSRNGITWSMSSQVDFLSFDDLYIHDYYIINDSIVHALMGDVMAGGLNKVRSIDYGRTWQSIPMETPFGDYVNASNGKTYVATTSTFDPSIAAQVYVSENLGETWQKITDGIPNTFAINAVIEGSDGKIYIAPEDYGVLRLEENRWKSLGTELAPYNVLDLISLGNKIYAFTQTNGIFVLK